MPQYAELDGQFYEFPDDATPEEMMQALGSIPAPQQPAVQQAAPQVAAPPQPGTSPSDLRVPLAGVEDMSPEQQAFAQRDREIAEAGMRTPPATWSSIGVAGADGARTGIANFLGIPVDLANGALAAAGVPTSSAPFLGSDMLDELLQTPSDLAYLATRPDAAYGSVRFEPQNRTERFANRVGEEIGGMVATGGFPVAKAIGSASAVGREAALQSLRRAAPAPMAAAAPKQEGFVGLIPGAIDALKQHNPAVLAKSASNAIQEAFLLNPSKVGLRETALAASAGAGANIATESFGDGPFTDLIGALLGAGAGSAAGAGAMSATNLGKALFSDGGDAVNEAVVAALLDAAGTAADTPGGADATPLMKALARDSDAEKLIPGLAPTTSDKLGMSGMDAEGARSLEYARSTGGPNVSRYNQARARNSGAIDDAVSEIAPTGSAAAFRDGLETQANARVSSAFDAANAAQTQSDELLSAIQPVSSQPARGAEIRGGLEKALQAAKAEETAAWAKVDGQVDLRGLGAEFDSLRSSLDPVAQQKFDPQSIPGAAALLGEEAGVQPLQNATALRSELTTELRKASLEANETYDPNRARVIGEYINVLDNYLDNNVAGDIEAYRAARETTRNVKDRFTRTSTDPVAQALDTRGTNYAREDSALPDMFVRENRQGPGNTQRLLEEADTPEVRAALEDQLLARLDGSAKSAASLQARADRFSDTFDLFPEAKGRTTKAIGAKQGAEKASAELKDVVREFGDGKTKGRSEVAKFIEYGGEQSSKALARVMKGKDPVRVLNELLDFAGRTPEVTEGAKRAFWDVMEAEAKGPVSGSGTGGEAIWKTAKWDKFLADHAETAKALYADDPTHYENLRKIAEAASSVDTGRTARPASSSGTAAGLVGSSRSSDLNLASLQSRYIDVARSRMSPLYFVTNTVTSVVRGARSAKLQSAFDAKLDEALIDPKVAAALLKEYNPRDLVALRQELSLVFGQRMSGLADAMHAEFQAQNEEAGNE